MAELINLIPIMTSNNSPSGIVSVSSIYSTSQGWYAFDRDTSTFWTTNSLNTGWIKYDFGINTEILNYSITSRSGENGQAPKNWILEGSNDDINWITLDTQSNQSGWQQSEKRVYSLTKSASYRYYRLNITSNNGNAYLAIGEMELLNKPIVNKILLLPSDGEVRSIEKGGYKSDNEVPAMTSNVTPIGEAFSSSNSANAYYVFDGVNTTGLQITTATGGGKFIYGYSFDTPKSIGKYSLMLNANISQAPKSWIFEGSNDGVSYEVLDSVTGEASWIAGVYKEFETETINQYVYYRINVTELNGAGAYIYDFKMFEVLPNKVKQLSSNTEQSFINYGMSHQDLASVDMYSDFTEKHYIQDVSTVLGSGKVFEQALDVNKVLKSVKVK